MLKTYYCHCRGPPKCPSSCSSSHAFMTGAMRAMRSAACCRILADLLLRRHLIVPHTCVRGGRGAPSSRVWGTQHVGHGGAGALTCLACRHWHTRAGKLTHPCAEGGWAASPAGLMCFHQRQCHANAVSACVRTSGLAYCVRGAGCLWVGNAAGCISHPFCLCCR